MGTTYKWSGLIGKATEGRQAMTVISTFRLRLAGIAEYKALFGNLMRNFASHGRRSLTTSVTVSCVTGAVLIPLHSLL